MSLDVSHFNTTLHFFLACRRSRKWLMSLFM